jgi:hypothetical protein
MPATSAVTGTLLYAIGHMHDGGTDMRLFVGGKLVCKSVMHYNAREGYNPGGHKLRKRQHGGHGAGDAKAMHISDPGACTDFGEVKTGDRLTAEVFVYHVSRFDFVVNIFSRLGTMLTSMVS